MTFDISVLLAGCFGGLLHEATRWVALRTAEALPQFMYKMHYWLLTLILILLGGLLAMALDPNSPTQAVYIGISAPAIISRIGALFPERIQLGDTTTRVSSWKTWIKG